MSTLMIRKQQHENSQQFVQAYEASKKCRRLADDNPPQIEATPDVKVNVGQVWLLPTKVPRLAIMIREWSEDNFLLAPCSKFEAPASDHELLIQLEHSKLVAQCWNVRTLFSDTIHKGQYIGDLDDNQVSEVFRVWNTTISDLELSDDTQSRIGLPMTRLPDDPRREYEREEARLWEQIDMADLALIEG